jgi:type III secretory pathway lipoprotein EscJ
MIVKLDTFQRDLLGVISLLLLDFTLIYGGFAHLHQDAPHQLPFLVQGVSADRVCHMRGNTGFGVENEDVVRRTRSLQMNQLPGGRFKEFGGQVGVVYEVEELIVTAQEAQNRELTSLIVRPLSEDAE